MVKKISLLCLFVFAFALSSLGAAMVSFLVIESGLPTESPSSLKAQMWENNLLEFFFETGHIVSNAPILRLPHKLDEGFPYEAELHFIEARNGGMDFFIVAIIEHPGPHNVTLRLFRTSSEEMLFELAYTARTYRSSREEQESIKNAVSIIAERVR